MIYAVLLFGVMGALYALLYYMNHKTPVPEGCEDVKAECNGCRVTSCANHPSHNMDEER